MTLKEITLLSVEEYQKYKHVIPHIKDKYWWLRSPGWDQDSVACVTPEGFVYEDGADILAPFAIRPALKINLEISDSLFWYKPEKLIGTKIGYGNYQWTILDTSLGELYVLCDNIIDCRYFDFKSNNWDASELKLWLNTEGLKLITI